ncbi:hypothetical protein FQZ97_1099520 [compost metagenome]
MTYVKVNATSRRILQCLQQMWVFLERTANLAVIGVRNDIALFKQISNFIDCRRRFPNMAHERQTNDPTDLLCDLDRCYTPRVEDNTACPQLDADNDILIGFNHLDHAVRVN